MSDTNTTIEQLKQQFRQFTLERNWDQWHSAKNMSMVAATEVAELMEIFRFYNEHECDDLMRDPEFREHVEDEIVDGVAALLRICDRYSIDLSTAFARKLHRNSQKYPVAESHSPGIDKVAWIHIRDGKVLAARTKGKEAFYIPGGKREGFESDVECLQREILEELSVNIRPDTLQLFGVFKAPAHGKPTGTNVIMKCYFADHTGEPSPANEIEELGWLSYADIHSDRTAPVDKLVLIHLRGLGLLE